jgi:phage recombination protein Bet
MTKEIALVNFNEDQLALIKSQIAKDCNTNELQLFLYQCKQTGLNPLTRQIYAIRRSGKMTIQTSIDGFRVIAERSGSYAGQDEPVWEDDEKGFPIKCTVKVYRFTPNFEQRYCAGVGVAHFKEYYPIPINLQKTMPHTMIAKVAEALALRKAFPQDLSGLYTSDEMSQADEVEVVNEEEPRNASGLKPNGDLANNKDMQETLNKKNEEDFAGLKAIIESCASEEELRSVWLEKENLKIINSLKKRRPELYDLLVNAKDEMKASFIEEVSEEIPFN